jgi:hypothetical protein
MVLYANSFVHIVMYSYYFVTSMWPQYRNNIWWKKHITQLQMVNNIYINLIRISWLLLGSNHGATGLTGHISHDVFSVHGPCKMVIRKVRQESSSGSRRSTAGYIAAEMTRKELAGVEKTSVVI